MVSQNGPGFRLCRSGPPGEGHGSSGDPPWEPWELARALPRPQASMFRPPASTYNPIYAVGSCKTGSISSLVQGKYASFYYANIFILSVIDTWQRSFIFSSLSLRLVASFTLSSLPPSQLSGTFLFFFILHIHFFYIV